MESDPPAETVGARHDRDQIHRLRLWELATTGDTWETCLTALGCGTGLETYTLAPGGTIQLRILLDEALPTRLGLLLQDGANATVAWSPALDPGSLGD